MTPSCHAVLCILAKIFQTVILHTTLACLALSLASTPKFYIDKIFSGTWSFLNDMFESCSKFVF
jgi:hypothetical protein